MLRIRDLRQVGPNWPLSWFEDGAAAAEFLGYSGHIFPGSNHELPEPLGFVGRPALRSGYLRAVFPLGRRDACGDGSSSILGRGRQGPDLLPELGGLCV